VGFLENENQSLTQICDEVMRDLEKSKTSSGLLVAFRDAIITVIKKSKSWDELIDKAQKTLLVLVVVTNPKLSTDEVSALKDDKIHKRLCMICHPDKGGSNAAFQQLNQLWDEHLLAVQNKRETKKNQQKKP
jgi:hypothetical protein